MDIPVHLHRWERRPFDWTAAAVAGLAGGAVLMVLELLWSALLPGPGGAWRTTRLVAALLLGPEVLWTEAQGFDLGIAGTALVTHYLLGVAFGLVLGFVAAGFHTDRNTPALVALGAAFGVVLYLVDFHVMLRWFPWFIELQGWYTLMAHVVFGVTAAVLYRRLARLPTGGERRAG